MFWPAMIEVGDDRRHHRRRPKRGDGEVVARSRSIGDAEQDAQRRPPAPRRDQRRPRTAMTLRHRDGRAVTAEPVKNRVAERGIAGETADDVPALCQVRPTAARRCRTGSARPSPNQGTTGERHRAARTRPTAHAFMPLPSKPPGRTISISTRMPKLSTSV